MRGGNAERKLGFKLLGEQFKNSHHYCAGLNFLRRYYRNPSGPDARSFLHMAVNEFTYMIEHLVPNSSLAGHSYLARGKAHMLAGEDSLALKDLREAVRYNPRLSAAYAAWANLLAKLGLTADAAKVLRQGLEQRPGSKLLKRRLTQLEGEGNR